MAGRERENGRNQESGQNVVKTLVRVALMREEGGEMERRKATVFQLTEPVVLADVMLEMMLVGILFAHPLKISGLVLLVGKMI